MIISLVVSQKYSLAESCILALNDRVLSYWKQLNRSANVKIFLFLFFSIDILLEGQVNIKDTLSNI